VFTGHPQGTTAYYLLGTTGWGTYNCLPTKLWPEARDSSVQANHFGFDIIASTNFPIVVEACTNLANSLWTSLTNYTLTTGYVYTNGTIYGSIYFSDTNNWLSLPHRFYRIRGP